jgi:hypothetical protein
VKGYLCNTPVNDCTGSLNKNGGNHKIHTSRTEARQCYVRWLTKKQGYTRLKGTQFAPPDGGPVLLVTKQSKYGLRMKGEGQKGKGRFVKDKDSICLIG